MGQDEKEATFRIKGKAGFDIDIERTKRYDGYSYEITIPYTGAFKSLQNERFHPKGLCVLDREKFVKEQGFKNCEDI